MSHIPMSDSECELAMSRLTPRLRQYAELLVRRGVAIQSGQELVVTAPVRVGPVREDRRGGGVQGGRRSRDAHLGR